MFYFKFNIKYMILKSCPNSLFELKLHIRFVNQNIIKTLL